MLKVLIIDDEEPVRRAVKKLGEWEKFGVQYILEGFNGEMGLTLLREHKPDIILVDMKMPVMDGVEFLNAARRENPMAEYIVISGYSDFEYTKQAIKVRVLDYLLKPISQDELNSVLQRAVDRIVLKQDESQKNIEKSIAKNMMVPLLREKVFNDLIMGDGNSLLLKEHERELNLRDGMSYGVALLCILNFEKICTEKFGGDTYLLYFSVINIVEELGNEEFRSYGIKSALVPHEIIIILGDRNENIHSNRGEHARTFLTKVTETLQELFEVYSIAVIGNFYEDIFQIKKSFTAAEAALNRVNLLNHSKNVFDENEINNSQEENSIKNKKLLIFNAVSSRNADYADQVIKDYFDEIKKAGNFNMQSAKRIVLEFMDIIEEIIKDYKISGAEGFITEIRDEFMFAKIKDIKELSDFLCKILKKVIYINNIGKSNNDKMVIQNIKKYIDENYSEEIKLGTFSEKFYMSKEYLCRIFKKEFGYGIYEYTLSIRMKKAKEMLENPCIQIQTVAEMLGYSDSNYFSKAFKKYYGHSPSENENRLRSNG